MISCAKIRRPEHSTRAVKIFSRGDDDVNRPVCCFLQPLEAGRSIRTVGEAARFVSLIEYQRIQVVGGTSGRSVFQVLVPARLNRHLYLAHHLRGWVKYVTRGLLGQAGADTCTSLGYRYTCTVRNNYGTL